MGLRLRSGRDMFFLCVSCFNSIYLSNNTIHEAWPWFSYHTTAGLHYFDLEGDHGPICQGPPARFLWGYTRKIENTFGPALATWHQQSEIRGLCETHSFEFDSTFPSSHPHCPRKDLLLDNWSQTVQDDIEAKQQLRKKNLARERPLGSAKQTILIYFFKTQY